MKPRLFSLIAVLATFVGGVVNGSWLNERKQRADIGDFVEWVNGHDMRTALGALHSFGITSSGVHFGAPPSRTLQVDVEDHQVFGVTAYLDQQRPSPGTTVTMDSPSGTIIHHAGQWIDIRPTLLAMARHCV